MPNQPHTPKPPAGIKDVLVNLRIAHESARGGVQLADSTHRAVPLAVRSGERELAREWVSELILTPPARPAHFEMVQTVFQGRPEFVAPWEVLDPAGADPEKAVPARALDAASGGPTEMTDAELALLLLDEPALTNFAELTHELMPDWWVDALAEAGRDAEPEPELEPDALSDEEAWAQLFDGELVLRNGPEEAARVTGAHPKGPDDTPLERTGPAEWTITPTAEWKQRLAETAFGDSGAAFVLRLHRLTDGRAELEMSPPPRNADVELRATFRTGDVRVFVVPVPAEAKIPGIDPAEIRQTTRSKPCDALPDAAFDITETELRAEGGILTLLFRSVGGESGTEEAEGDAMPTLAEMLERTTDPAALLPLAWWEAVNGKLDGNAAFQLAASPALARAATPESTAGLIGVLEKVVDQYGEHAFDFANMIESHASALDGLGRSRLALPLYEAIRPTFEQFAEPRQLGNYYMSRAVVLTKLGSPDAVAGFDAALPVLKEHAPPAEYALCLMNRAGALAAQGKHGDAMAGCDMALPLLKEHAPPANYARCLMSRAATLQVQGKHGDAVAGFDAALPLLKEHAPPAIYAQGLMNRANALAAQGKHGDAVTGYDTALPVLKEHAPPADYALCLMNRASALQAQGKHGDAVVGYDAALPVLKEHAPPAEYALCLMNRASALTAQGKHRDAVAGYDTALPVLKEHAPPADYAACLINRASALREQGEFGDAVTGYDAARRVVRQARRHAGADDTGIEFHAGYEKLYRGAVRAGLEGDLLDSAYAAVRDGKAGVVEDITFKLTYITGDEPETVGVARTELTQWLRTQFPRKPQTEEPTEAEIEQFYEGVVRFRSGREVRTQQYLSAWGQHAHTYNAARAAVPTVEDLPTRAEVQKELPERWALIDFWRTGDDKFHAFVLFRNDFRVVPLPFPVGEHAEKLNRLADGVRTVSESVPQLDALDDLGNLLFRPLLPLLRERGIEGVYLVPHEFLHLFPLHAARFGTKYLCDEFAVAYLPSANMLPRLPRPDPSGNAFVLANPEHGTGHSLPFSHWEGEQLRRRLPVEDGRFFLGQAGRYAATEKWADCGFVHFSCHGHGDEQFAARSHLRLADDLLLAHDVLHRRPPLKTGATVVLNGCQTSVPDWRAVNEGMGLMTAFLLRGAGTVFSTQWSVLDMCAAPMVLTFADRTRAGAAPAVAMRAAQTALRQMTPQAMLAQMQEVKKMFPAGSVEAGKVRAQEAWLCWRAGLFDDAVLAAREAAVPLRDAGLDAEAALLLDRTESAKRRNLPGWVRQTGFDSPVFWGAFQLVGRVT